jgi:3-oxoacyl-[acyl-carrier protein] reductase
MYDFSTNIAAVTGAGKGLGAAIAARLLEDGVQGVALLDIDEALVQETAAKFGGGARVLPVVCDVSDEGSVASAFAKIFEVYGRVDILVNNAGITRDSMFHKMQPDAFRKVIDVHVGGAYLCTSQVVPGMRERGFGRIISMSSVAAFGNVGQANYSAAKAALIGLTNTLALELAAKNITVNCIAPGLINTDIIKTIPEQVLQSLTKRIPMGRIGEPEEVANLVAFLASDQANYITGQCILCAGGTK